MGCANSKEPTVPKRGNDQSENSQTRGSKNVKVVKTENVGKNQPAGKVVKSGNNSYVQPVSRIEQQMQPQQVSAKYEGKKQQNIAEDYTKVSFASSCSSSEVGYKIASKDGKKKAKKPTAKRGNNGMNSSMNNSSNPPPGGANQSSIWDRLHQGRPTGPAPSSPPKSDFKSKTDISRNTGNSTVKFTSVSNPQPALDSSVKRLNNTYSGRSSSPTNKKDDSKPLYSTPSSRGGTTSVKGVKRPQSGKKAKSDKGPNLPSLTAEEQVMAEEILDHSPGVKFEDIAGLAAVKELLHEIIVAPSLNPALFTGLRSPAKGVLLFGPPGNGKTLLAKAIATECKAYFISISASSITSKYVGESEKHIRSLFSLARKLQPCIIFIDEIDSMLTSRSANEHDAARRLKTEFLVQMDGVGTAKEDRILVLGATNRPFELDDAALRRLPRRVLIPLPDRATRKGLVAHKLHGENVELDPDKVAQLTEGYSCSDLAALCTEAAMMPIREISNKKLATTLPSSVRPIILADFKQALKAVRPSVDRNTLKRCEEWNSHFGSQ